ncbi:hypothetical protein PV04_06590 [Phialophora macrospora]|uniref:Uncharacterized protein n=1 Tax=Phialophora macrospora TaxID=1851006 RepID=A0A0D2DYX3_9EURO|nr:hypothetical protein PV04_06590 [Phialophora macrospora]
MIKETNDEMAWRLVWTSQWKLQQESEHIEPTLPKMIGHLSVYNQVSEYMQNHNVDDFILGNDDDDAADVINEFSQILSKDSSPPALPVLVRPSSVVVTAVEIDGDKAEKDPFADDEESSSHGDEDEDNDAWSSDEETEFGSVSSVEDEEHDADHHTAKLSSIEEDDEGEADISSLLNGETT